MLSDSIVADRSALIYRDMHAIARYSLLQFKKKQLILSELVMRGLGIIFTKPYDKIKGALILSEQIILSTNRVPVNV